MISESVRVSALNVVGDEDELAKPHDHGTRRPAVQTRKRYVLFPGCVTWLDYYLLIIFPHRESWMHVSFGSVDGVNLI